MRRMRTGRDAALIPAPQDDLCLAFANTRFWRGRDTPSESLGGIEDLLAWLAGTAKFPVESIEAAGNRLRRHPHDAAALFAGDLGRLRSMRYASRKDGVIASSTAARTRGRPSTAVSPGTEAGLSSATLTVTGTSLTEATATFS